MSAVGREPSIESNHNLTLVLLDRKGRLQPEGDGQTLCVASLIDT